MTAPDEPPLDLRLAAGALVAWAALLCCRAWTTVAVVALCAALAVVTAVALRMAARQYAGRAAACAAVMCCCLLTVLVPLAGRMHLARASPLWDLARRHAAVVLQVRLSADPAPLSARGPAGSPRVIVRAGDVVVIGAADGWQGMLPGQRVRVSGTLAPPLDAGQLVVTLFADAAPTPVGRAPWWQRVAGRVRSDLRSASAVLPAEPRGLLPGIVDGDTSGLDPVLAERFRIAGLTHLVAVSGTNCSILLGVVVLGLRRARLQPWLCAVAGVLVVIGFVVVARPSPSVLRAAVMALIALGALAGGRPRAALPALAVAVLGLLATSSALATDLGFAMSVAATAALLVLSPPWAAAMRRRGMPSVVAEPLAVAMAAHLATAPLIAVVSAQVSLVAIPANVLAEAAVLPATVAGFAAAVLAPVFLPGAHLLAEVAGVPCRWLIWVADTFGSVPGAVLPWPGGGWAALLLAVVIAVLLALLAYPRGRRTLALAALVAALVQFPVRWSIEAWPPSGAVFVMCDVGQGDGLIVPTGPGAAMVVDAGPEPIAIDRCLRDLGVTAVPLLVLTHLHLDHVGGIDGVLRGRHVGAVVTGPLREPATGLHVVEHALRAHALTLGSVAAGQRFPLGAAAVEVLGPAAAFHGTHSDPNNSAVVLRVTVGATRLLLAGDMEIEAEHALLAAHVDVRADVLKVAHHGSRFFVPEFLAAVHARVGLISVGAHNDYGHPARELLSALSGLGVPAWRTDLDGDLAVTGNGAELRVVKHGTRASRVGVASAPALAPPALSAVDAKMDACRRPSSCWTHYPTSSLGWSSCSATRSCSSTEPAARSPPPLPATTLRSPRPRSRGLTLPVRSCTSCSARRCSARRASCSCGPRRTSRPRHSRSWRRIWPRPPRALPSCCTTPAAPRARPCSRRPGGGALPRWRAPS
jgi:competence protein ComEC